MHLTTVLWCGGETTMAKFNARFFKPRKTITTVESNVTNLLTLFQFLGDSNKSNNYKAFFITPDMAKDILATMSKPNRPNSYAYDKLFKGFMLSGKWTNYHPEGLMIDTNNKLHEGYGRMTTLSKLGGYTKRRMLGCLKLVLRERAERKGPIKPRADAG